MPNESSNAIGVENRSAAMMEFKLQANVELKPDQQRGTTISFYLIIQKLFNRGSQLSKQEISARK